MATPERCPNGTRLAPGHLWEFPETQPLRICLACGFEEPDDAFQRGYEAAKEQAAVMVEKTGELCSPSVDATLQVMAAAIRAMKEE